MNRYEFIEHLEKHLGKISKGWIAPKESTHRFSVAKFPNQPVEGLNTYSTLGVSSHDLKVEANKSLRQELLMSALSTSSENQVADLLLRMGDLVLTKHMAIPRGQVIGPGKPFFEDSKMNALYATYPVIFDDSFSPYILSNFPPTFFVWLIPIYDHEANFISNEGCENFENKMEEKDPDLWDFQREPII